MQRLRHLWFMVSESSQNPEMNRLSQYICGTKQLSKMLTSNVRKNLVVIKSSNLCEAKMKSMEDDTNYRLIILRISLLFTFLSKM